MACGDVLSLEDLQTAKKHQIFEAEVITGKVGGVAGGATIDTATNPVTGQTQQTLPSILADLGFDVQSWTSSTGGVLASANQVFLNDTPGSLWLGDYYAWGGPFPKTVPAGTDPALPTSGYIMRSSRFAGTQAREALRRSYAEAGYNLVDGSFEAGGTLVNANDVLLQERTGKAFTGPAGTVAAGMNPASGGFVDKSSAIVIPVTYAGIRAYSGSADRLDCIGRTNIFDRANGLFVRKGIGTGLVDNDITILIDALGRPWERVITDDILPEWAGAKGDGVAIDTVPMQKALDLNRRVRLSAPATYLIDRTLTLPTNASIIGESKSNSIIRKVGAATKQILVTAGALAGGYTGVIPSNVNAVLALGNLTSSRWMGQLQNFSLYGEKPTSEGQLCEFGIVNGGIVSDAQINDVLIYDCQYAGVLPVAFASVIENNRFTTCLHGFFINNGTSTRYTTNYAVKCRDYAHYIRDFKYSTISANASDFLNDNVLYPDRTRLCAAYVLQSLLGCSVRNNGQEGTLGTNWKLRSFDHSEFIGNTSIRLGSDYIGTEHVAWLDMDDTIRNSDVCNNFSYDYNANGVLFGGADPAKHHNILVEGNSFLRVKFGANVVRASRNGMPVEAGYLNNQLAGLVNNELIDTSVNLNGNVGLMPTITVEAGSDAVITYGANNRAQRKYIGGCLHISGVIDATITHTTGTSQRIGVGNIPQNNISGNLIRIPIAGVDFGDTAFLAGFIPNSFRVSSPGGGGLLYSVTNVPIRLDKVVSGQRFLIHYQGFYSI